MRKAAGGLLGYGLGTLCALFVSPNVRVSLAVDGGGEFSGPVLGIAAGNGDLTAGGMSLTPGAAPDDGLLNLLTIHGLSTVSRLLSFPKIYSGTHVGARAFSYRTIRRCTVSASRPLTVAADGEVIGTLPCAITVLEHAIEIRAPRRREGSGAGERMVRHAEAGV
jgi:diacylglycerol kinase (ATP)